MGRVTVAVAVSLWVIPISIVVNRIVPDPYMDEIFHVPQAQQYCRGDFRSWDPMITTPPGLYYLSLAYVVSLFPVMRFVKAAGTLSDVCSTVILRSTNAIAAISCSILVYELIVVLRPNIGEKKATSYAIVIAMYPLHWFFTFLYYTDVASVTAVLAMYLACLKRKYWLSATLGALATLFRQTNIIWMLFVAANGALSYVEDLYKKDSLLWKNHKFVSGNIDTQTDKRVVPTAPGLRSRRMHNFSTQLSSSKESSHQLEDSQSPEAGWSDDILDTLSMLWRWKWKLILVFSPFVLVLLAFVAFVAWNGSIVLGAKEAHAVSVHFAQMMYFALCSSAALVSVHFSLTRAATLWKSFSKNRILGCFIVFVALVLGIIAVHFFSIAHPYLLADNRHYPFYIWRRVIQAHWMMKYLLIPLYMYSWFSIIGLLGKSQGWIWVLSYVIATALVLVPAPLIEFRYYTIPFYFLILHSRIDDAKHWLACGALYAIVNVFTLFVFLFHPFQWDHEPGVQRFIW